MNIDGNKYCCSELMTKHEYAQKNLHIFCLAFISLEE